MTVTSPSKAGSGPLVEYLVPSLSDPVMTPVVLSMVTEATCLASTFFRKLGYWICVTDDFESSGGMITTAKTATISRAKTHRQLWSDPLEP